MIKGVQILFFSLLADGTSKEIVWGCVYVSLQLTPKQFVSFTFKKRLFHRSKFLSLILYNYNGFLKVESVL